MGTRRRRDEQPQGFRSESASLFLSSRIGRSLGRVASWLAIASILFAVVALLVDGLHAIRVSMIAEEGGIGAIGSALRAIIVAPMFVVAYHYAQLGRARPASLWLAAALFLLSLMTAIPRGAYASGWYLQPLLVMIVALTLGVIPGLTMALLACTAHLSTAWLIGEGHVAFVHTSVWSHALAVCAVILATGLLGAFLHHALCIAIDVETTQRRRISETMKALRYRERLLRHAMRLQTVGSLTSMVVHQLRNHFQVMMGNVALGRRSEGEEKEQRLARIQDALQKSNGLLDQLLNIAHPGEERRERLDLGRAVADIVERVSRVVSTSLVIDFEGADRPLPVRIDPVGLEDVVLNLVINAKHAMGGTGTLKIRVRPEGRDAAVVTVTDEGCGIAPEHLANIFKPFFTTKPMGEGTGLGLAAVNRFMVQSGGQVDVDSDVGRGTTFTLWFRLTKGAVDGPAGSLEDPVPRQTG